MGLMGPKNSTGLEHKWRKELDELFEELFNSIKGEGIQQNKWM